MGLLNVDGGTSGAPVDVIDAGATATPPDDVYDSAHLLSPLTVEGNVEPVFTGVSSTDAAPTGRVLVVRVGATSATVTVQVPGVQPFTEIERANLAVAGLQNEDRVFWLPPLVAEPQSRMAVVFSDPPDDVSAALLEVDR